MFVDRDQVCFLFLFVFYAGTPVGCGVQRSAHPGGDGVDDSR